MTLPPRQESTKVFKIDLKQPLFDHLTTII